MNKLKGHIVNIDRVDDLSLIEIDIDGCFLKTIIIDDLIQKNYKKGNCVHLFFKETEVVLAKDLNLSISMQNRMHCKVKSIKKGKLLSEIKLDFNSNELTSLITSKSLIRLNIKNNDDVLVLIKTNQIMLSKC